MARWKAPVLLFGVALALRLAHLATVRHSPFFTRLWLDLAFFDEWARTIAAGNWLGSGLFYQDPLYPYFLGAFYAVFGHEPALAVTFQLVLGSLVPVLVFDAVRRSIGNAQAWVAGILAALYVPSIFYEGLVLKSWMDTFLAAAALACLALAIERRSRTTWAATGLVFGIACLCRGNLILVLPALALWIWLDPSAIPARRRQDRLRAALAFVAGAGLVLGATALRNRAVSGEWVLTTAQAGQNFYLGNHPWSPRGEYEPPPFLRTNPKYEEADFTAEARRRSGREMTATERSRFWFREGMAWIRANPDRWLHRSWLKLRYFWGAYEIPDNIDLYVYREYAPVLRAPLADFGLVAPLALLGAALGFRRPGWVRALLVFLGVYMTAVVLFFVLSRYRLTALPALFAFAGMGTVELWNRGREVKRRRRLTGPFALAMGLWVAFACFVSLPLRLPPDDPAFKLASALGLPTRAESVAVEHFNLGVVYAKEGSLTQAEEQLRRAVEEEPNHPRTHLELGKVLAREGKTEEALASFLRAAELEPGNATTFHVLGILYRREGDRAGAERAFRQALAIDPRRKDTARELESLGR
ncbi:MAG TPA: glycosyltransferase family 39 protein [Candidatus Polarisedimenticolaceae bacterium]|nr:glycosyltransferase family 39 protein [Candidatus Polarisedimenticolaceae bacterium]